MRRCVWSRNIKSRCSIYIYDISSLMVNDLPLILLTWRKWWANNASKYQMRFNSEFKGLNADLNIICHFLALLGAHPIFHVCRISVKAMKIFVIFFLNSGGYYTYPESIIKKTKSSGWTQCAWQQVLCFVKVGESYAVPVGTTSTLSFCEVAQCVQI